MTAEQNKHDPSNESTLVPPADRGPRWLPLYALSVLALLLTLIGVAYIKDAKEAQLIAERTKSDSKVVINPDLCDRWVTEFEDHGYIKMWPEPHVAAVDFQKWNSLPTDKKRVFAAAVRCYYLRGKMLREGPNGYIVIRSYPGNDLLATAVRAGVHLQEIDP